MQIVGTDNIISTTGGVGSNGLSGIDDAPADEIAVTVAPPLPPENDASFPCRTARGTWRRSEMGEPA